MGWGPWEPGPWRPFGTESRPGRLKRPGDHAPRAGGEAAAPLSRSGELQSSWVAGWSETGVQGEAGFCLPSAVCLHSHPRKRVLLHSPFPLAPQLCAQGPRGSRGWPRRRREGVGLRGWRGSCGPRTVACPAGMSPTPCQGMRSPQQP